MDFGDIAGAEMYYNQVLLTYYLPEDLELEATLFGEWMSLRMTLINSGRSWKNLTSFELDELYNLVDHYKTWVGRSAMQVLNEYNSEIFELPPAFSQPWDPRLVFVSSTSQQFTRVFPNPADFVVNFIVHCSSADDKSGTLRIFDGMGREILEKPITESNSQFIIDVSRWTTGIYMYEIVLPAIGKQSGKFDVQH
jgi:hypothetical protein